MFFLTSGTSKPSKPSNFIIIHQKKKISKKMTFSIFSKFFHKTLSFGSRNPLSDCFDALERWAISKSSGYVESQLILWGPRYCFSPDNGRPGGGPRSPSRGMTFADCCHWRRRRRRGRRRRRRRSPDFSLKSNNPNLKGGEKNFKLFFIFFFESL